jgi:hypothetical protein
MLSASGDRLGSLAEVAGEAKGKAGTHDGEGNWNFSGEFERGNAQWASGSIIICARYACQTSSGIGEGITVCGKGEERSGD